jgi:hypothetical protein
MMMERDFAEEMTAQEELSTRQSGQEGWIGRIKGAMASDEKVEPFHFKPQVCPVDISTDILVSCAIEQYPIRAR